MGAYPTSYNMGDNTNRKEIPDPAGDLCNEEWGSYENSQDRNQDDVQEGEESEEYFKIPLETLRLDAYAAFSIYLKISQNSNYVLYREGNLKFGEVQKQKLIDNNISEIYIHKSQRRLYRRYLEENLEEIVADESFPIQKKSEIVYQCANDLTQELFEHPRVGENMTRVSKMVNNTVNHIHRGTEVFASMLGIMSHDYYTYTHSVNVSVIGIALAQEIGIAGSDLRELGSGLMLHDLGKSQIDHSILNKRGPLNDEEWIIIRQHPDMGVKLVSGMNRVPKAAFDVIRQHHEKCTGKGYPQCLKENEIHVYAKIAAIADVFDALTTDRPYKDALNAYSAMQLMHDKMAGDFDMDFFRELVFLLNIKSQ